MKNITVYHNDKNGFVVNSLVKAKGKPALVSTYPAIYVDAKASRNVVAASIEEALHISETHEEMSIAEASQYHFWDQTGCKSFSAFSRIVSSTI